MEYLVERTPNIEILKLGNNCISSLNEVKKLCKLQYLKHLDLIGNPICELANYTDKIFKELPELDILDG